jgi:hypothetical protein
MGSPVVKELLEDRQCRSRRIGQLIEETQNVNATAITTGFALDLSAFADSEMALA